MIRWRVHRALNRMGRASRRIPDAVVVLVGSFLIGALLMALVMLLT